MRRFTWLLLAGVPSLLGAQGFGVYEHNTCTMGRGGVAAARPCADGSAIFFNPAGLAGLAGSHLSAGVTAIHAQGGFTDDLFAQKTDLTNPTIPVPNGFFTHAMSPKLTVGIGVYAPYGLETKWPLAGFDGRFMGYNTKIHSFYVQPTVGYQVGSWLKVGVGVAYIHGTLGLHQRLDLASQSPAPGITFASLGVLPGTDFANADLTASGNGFAVNFGGIIKVTDRFSIGGHWLTRKTISFDGDAVFTQVATGLTLAPNNPLSLPGGTPVDAVLAPEFGAGGPLASGAATTSIILPPQGSLGFAYTLRDNWTVMADFQYVVWGWFQTVIIKFQNPATPTITLNPSNKDTYGIRLGTEYSPSAKLTLRGGYLYHTASSPVDFVTPLLPEAPRNEFTVGLGYAFSPKLHGDLAYQYIAQQDRRGRVFPPPVSNTGVYEFSAHLFGAGLAFTF
jgi:long-chain fatty acid transport protein